MMRNIKMQSKSDYSEILALVLSCASVMVIIVSTLVLLTSCGTKGEGTTNLACSQSGNNNQQNCAQGDGEQGNVSNAETRDVDAEDEKECCGDICVSRGNTRGSDGFIDCVIECLDESQCTKAPDEEESPSL